MLPIGLIVALATLVICGYRGWIAVDECRFVKAAMHAGFIIAAWGFMLYLDVPYWIEVCARISRSLAAY